MTGTLVIGGGIAGHTVAEHLRGSGYQAPITILCAEPHAPYDRVRLASLLEGADISELSLRPESWYADRAIDLRIGVTAERIDLPCRQVGIGEGERLAYEHLVIATGSTPIVPPIAGANHPGVVVFRTPADCAAMRAAAATSGRACVLGGGLLGLEAARGLHQLGVRTTVLHLMDVLMERQLDADAGALLVSAMADLGVEVQLGRQVTRVVADGAVVTGVGFADGTELPCDLLVVCAGIRPNVDLARDAGIKCERAIIVDDQMQTSADAVLAVGECAQHDGVVYGLVSPIIDQARVAAQTIIGAEPRRYHGSFPSATLKVMGVDLITAGVPTASGGCTVADPERRIYRRLLVSDGRAVGTILMGDTRGADHLVSLVAKQAQITDPLATLAGAATCGAADLADDAQVCSCHGVSKGEIIEAIRAKGYRTPSEVQTATRAGTGCGGCRVTVTEIVAAEVGEFTDEPAYLCPCRQLERAAIEGAVRSRGLRSVGEVAEACGAGIDCGACKPAIAYLVSLASANRHREERHSRFINDRVHANIQRDGTFSVVPRIYGGVTSPDQLRRIADVADRHKVPMLKITGGQRIDMLGVRKEQLPAIWADLGMSSGHAYAKAIRTVKTCVGNEFCRFGIGDAIGLGIALERAWEGLYTPHKVKSAVSGCPRNCAEALVKDIGVVAVEGGWEILVGGAAGSTVRRGDLLARVDTEAQVVRVASAFLQYYREHAEYLERTYAFVERVGIEVIRHAVIDDAASADALRKRLGQARRAAQDPWATALAGARTEFHEISEEIVRVGPPADGAFEDADTQGAFTG